MRTYAARRQPPSKADLQPSHPGDPGDASPRQLKQAHRIVQLRGGGASPDDGCIQLAHKGSKDQPVTRQHVTEALKEMELKELHIPAIGKTVPVSVLGVSVSMGDASRLRVRLAIVPDEDMVTLVGTDQEPCIQVGDLCDLNVQQAALKNRLREAYAGHWLSARKGSQALQEPAGKLGEPSRTEPLAIEAQASEPKSTPPERPSMEAKEPARPLAQRPVVGARFKVEPVTDTNRSEVLGVLKEWESFAKDRFVAIAQEFRASRSQRDKMVDWEFSGKEAKRVDHYYDKAQLAFRKKHKAQSVKRKNMDGALNEIKELLEGIAKLHGEALAKKFRIARHAGAIGGVMEGSSGGNTFIANLATNPMNIDPPLNYEPVSGAAQALIGSMISANVMDNKDGFEDMRLFALNNLVKQIYDHFGFRVITDKEERVRRNARRGETLPQLPPRLERPPHPKTEQKTAPNPKTEWHELKNMMMAEPQAKAFLKKIAIDQGLIDLPPEVRSWIGQ